MTDYSELKRLASLAKNWSGEIGEDDWYTACCFDKPKFSVPDAEFIAKCEPGSVLALIAEVEALRSQVATLQSDANSWQSGYDEGRRMGTKTVLDEREQLRKDAERYRYVRNCLHMETDILVTSKKSAHPYGDLGVYSCSVLDEIIDEALSKGEKP